MKKLSLAFVCLLLAAIVVGAMVGSCSSPAPKQLATFVHNDTVDCVAFSPDGRYLVGGSSGFHWQEFWQGWLKVWDVAMLKEIASLKLPQRVRCVAFSPRGDLLAVGTGNINNHGDQKDYLGFKVQPGDLRLFSFPQLKEAKSIQVGQQVQQVLFSADGNSLAA